MKKFSLNDIVLYTSGDVVLGNVNSFIDDIVIDSREVNSSSLFIPIIGERFDGHDFMEGAYLNGCRNFLCDINHEFYKDDINLIKVKDTTLALGDISKGYKNNFSIPFVAVTGSVGKTSTKDMIYSVLNQKFNAFKTEGNFNNNIGLPRTLLRLDDSYEIGVIEMGMDKKGEISYLSSIVNPKIGVITNIGLCHIEFFDSQEGIFDAKMEIVENFDKNNLLIVNGDDEFLKRLNREEVDYRLVKCGFGSDNDIYCKSYEFINNGISFVCVYNNEEHEFFINNLAKHNILNAMFSIAVALEYKLNYEEIRNGLLNFELSKNRLDIFDTDKYKIINDSYNANFESMKGALQVLELFEGRKVAILGDMFELREYTCDVHKNVGKLVNSDVLITIGNNSKYIGEGAIDNGFDKDKYYHFLTKEDFYDKMGDIILNGDTILIKASHAMEFDKIVEVFRKL